MKISIDFFPPAPNESRALAARCTQLESICVPRLLFNVATVIGGTKRAAILKQRDGTVLVCLFNSEENERERERSVFFTRIASIRVQTAGTFEGLLFHKRVPRFDCLWSSTMDIVSRRTGRPTFMGARALIAFHILYSVLLSNVYLFILYLLFHSRIADGAKWLKS